jgi:ubiquinone/menaquinone biosynthesis C-methylase UbiE
MPAAYDTYDYPAYWDGREYEHQAEIIAIQSFLHQIPHKIKRALEIGGGYGRLVPAYMYRSDKIVLTDPSKKLLSLAEKNLSSKMKKRKIQFLQSKIETLSSKLKPKSVDLIVIVRVLHHIYDIDRAFETISRLTKKNGYLVLEFANKMHAKAAMIELCRGNFTFPLDLEPKDIRSQKSIDDKTLPFVNYHPDTITKKLQAHGYKIIETRSVSNVRSTFLKRILPREILLSFEKMVQGPFAKLFFGPSIFILAKKVG